MKKILFLILCFMNIFSIQAQTSTKPVVFVRDVNGLDFKDELVADVRSNLLSGLIASERVVVRDYASDAEFQSALKARTADSEMSEKDFGFQLIRQLDARWIIDVTITRIDCKQDSDPNNSLPFTGAVEASVSLIDVATGTLKSTETITADNSSLVNSLKENGSCYGSTAEEAVANSIKLMSNRMKAYAEKTFKVEGCILELDQVKKEKAKTAYINLGSASGVKVGDIFEVFQSRVIAGRSSKKKIGELKVASVEGEDIALCDVKNGDEEIYAAMQKLGEGEVLSIQSRAKKNPLGKAGSFLGL